MPPVVRVAVQCSSPLVRAVLVRHLTVARDLDVIGPAALGPGDTLIQVVRARTPRSTFATRSTVAMGLRVIVLIDGGAGVDLTETSRSGITAMAPLAAVTGALLQTMIRGGGSRSPAQMLARFEALAEGVRHRDSRWVAVKMRSAAARRPAEP